MTNFLVFSVGFLCVFTIFCEGTHHHLTLQRSDSYDDDIEQALKAAHAKSDATKHLKNSVTKTQKSTFNKADYDLLVARNQQFDPSRFGKSGLDSPEFTSIPFMFPPWLFPVPVAYRPVEEPVEYKSDPTKKLVESDTNINNYPEIELKNNIPEALPNVQSYPNVIRSNLGLPNIDSIDVDQGQQESMMSLADFRNQPDGDSNVQTFAISPEDGATVVEIPPVVQFIPRSDATNVDETNENQQIFAEQVPVAQNVLPADDHSSMRAAVKSLQDLSTSVMRKMAEKDSFQQPLKTAKVPVPFTSYGSGIDTITPIRASEDSAKRFPRIQYLPELMVKNLDAGADSHLKTVDQLQRNDEISESKSAQLESVEIPSTKGAPTKILISSSSVVPKKSATQSEEQKEVVTQQSMLQQEINPGENPADLPTGSSSNLKTVQEPASNPCAEIEKPKSAIASPTTVPASAKSAGAPAPPSKVPISVKSADVPSRNVATPAKELQAIPKLPNAAQKPVAVTTAPRQNFQIRYLAPNIGPLKVNSNPISVQSAPKMTAANSGGGAHYSYVPSQPSSMMNFNQYNSMQTPYSTIQSPDVIYPLRYRTANVENKPLNVPQTQSSSKPPQYITSPQFSRSNFETTPNVQNMEVSRTSYQPIPSYSAVQNPNANYQLRYSTSNVGNIPQNMPQTQTSPQYNTSPSLSRSNFETAPNFQNTDSSRSSYQPKPSYSAIQRPSVNYQLRYSTADIGIIPQNTPQTQSFPNTPQYIASPPFSRSNFETASNFQNQDVSGSPYQPKASYSTVQIPNVNYPLSYTTSNFENIPQNVPPTQSSLRSSQYITAPAQPMSNFETASNSQNREASGSLHEPKLVSYPSVNPGYSFPSTFWPTPDFSIQDTLARGAEYSLGASAKSLIPNQPSPIPYQIEPSSPPSPFIEPLHNFDEPCPAQTDSCSANFMGGFGNFDFRNAQPDYRSSSPKMSEYNQNLKNTQTIPKLENSGSDYFNYPKSASSIDYSKPVNVIKTPDTLIRSSDPSGGFQKQLGYDSTLPKIAAPTFVNYNLEKVKPQNLNQARQVEQTPDIFHSIDGKNLVKAGLQFRQSMETLPEFTKLREYQTQSRHGAELSRASNYAPPFSYSAPKSNFDSSFASNSAAFGTPSPYVRYVRYSS